VDGGIKRYDGVAQALHWLMALGIFVMFGLAFYMSDLPIGPYKVKVYNLHKSIGLVVLILACLRLAWRVRHPAPPLPESIPGWERKAAHASHH
jgi:cytochrome b561